VLGERQDLWEQLLTGVTEELVVRHDGPPIDLAVSVELYAKLGPCQLLKIGAVREPEARVPAGIAAFSGLLSPDAGWCCSVCAWGMTAPRLDSTVAALAFNRVAQEDFEKHDCARNTPT